MLSIKALAAFAVALLCGVACAADYDPGPARVHDKWPGTRVFDKVVVFVLENKGYDQAWALPYMRELATEGVLFKQYYAVEHPSYPNYLAMIAGDTFGVTSDEMKTFTGSTLTDRLEAKGFTWKVYAEGYPGDCFLGDRSGAYVRRHVPMLSFSAVRDDRTRCANIVDGPAFANDVSAGTLPNYALYVPDQHNNGHDTDMTYAARALRDVLEPLLASRSMDENLLVVVTFDEGAAGEYETNQIYTVLLGPLVKAGHFDSTEANHYNLLRTIEDNFGLERLGRHDEENGPLLNWWQAPH